MIYSYFQIFLSYILATVRRKVFKKNINTLIFVFSFSPGYGHIAPTTVGGKIFSIFYALVGMPLFLLYLSNIGDIMATSFKWTYSRCCQCKQKRRRHNTGGVSSRDGGSSLYSVKFLPTTLHPDLVATSSSGEEGGSLTSGSGGRQDQPALPEPTGSGGGPLRQLSVIRNNSTGELVLDPSQLRVYDDDEDDDGGGSYTSGSSSMSSRGSSSGNKPLREVTVPISLCLTVMVSYICGGAVLFGEWEGWGFLDGSYFCFITLSTIGFGDIVPGDSLGEDLPEGEGLVGLVNVQFIFCSMYILIGMAVIAMCFNLMQESVVTGITKLGKKLGIIKDD